MKITNSETIKSSERELIDAITGDLDWGTIEELIRQRHKLAIQDDVEYKEGDIIVHENKVAYRLDFEVKMVLSVIFDRHGNFLSMKTNEPREAPEPEDATESIPADGENHEDASTGGESPDRASAAPEPSVAADEIVKLTSELADMSEAPPMEAPEENASGESPETPVQDDARQEDLHEETAPQERMSNMASRIADMITKINEE